MHSYRNLTFWITYLASGLSQTSQEFHKGVQPWQALPRKEHITFCQTAHHWFLVMQCDSLGMPYAFDWSFGRHWKSCNLALQRCYFEKGSSHLDDWDGWKLNHGCNSQNTHQMCVVQAVLNWEPHLTLPEVHRNDLKNPLNHRRRFTSNHSIW